MTDNLTTWQDELRGVKKDIERLENKLYDETDCREIGDLHSQLAKLYQEQFKLEENINEYLRAMPDRTDEI